MIKLATFSDDRKYRFKLEREWVSSKPKVMFIGLNPSTANETDDVATIRRCIGFAKSWGYGGMIMTNLYSYVSTDPDELITSGEDLSKNNSILLETAEQCDKVVCAWGCFKKHKKRMDDVRDLFSKTKINLWCIELSKDDYPKHPLYLKADLQPGYYLPF